MKNKDAIISETGCDLFGRVYFTDNDGYQNFLISVRMLNSLILDSNNNVTD